MTDPKPTPLDCGLPAGLGRTLQGKTPVIADPLFDQFRDRLVKVHFSIGNNPALATGILRRKLGAFWHLVGDPDIQGSVVTGSAVRAADVVMIEELDKSALLAAIAERREAERAAQHGPRIAVPGPVA